MAHGTDDGLDLSEFEELYESRYPGSKKVRRMLSEAVAPTPAEVSAAWDAKPKLLTVRGEEHEFFLIGDLAKALGRKPVTIRMWEQQGILPRARYWKGKVEGKKQRLYTRAQVEGVVLIAHEEGILPINKTISFESTSFTVRVLELWKETNL